MDRFSLLTKSRYLLCGMVLLYKNSAERKGLKYLQAGLDSLEGKTHSHRHSFKCLYSLQGTYGQLEALPASSQIWSQNDNGVARSHVTFESIWLPAAPEFLIGQKQNDT